MAAAGSEHAVLAIDTAGPVIGAAVQVAGELVGDWSARVVRGADAALLPAVQALLTYHRFSTGRWKCLRV